MLNSKHDEVKRLSSTVDGLSQNNIINILMTYLKYPTGLLTTLPPSKTDEEHPACGPYKACEIISLGLAKALGAS